MVAIIGGVILYVAMLAYLWYADYPKRLSSSVPSPPTVPPKSGES